LEIAVTQGSAKNVLNVEAGCQVVFQSH
jgi:hypothetical protein